MTDSPFAQLQEFHMRNGFKVVFVLATAALLTFGAGAQPTAERLTVYSGRNEELIGPLVAQFTAETGIEVDVLYGDTAGVANQILEEGANSPADVYIGQDAGALGALAKAGVLATLPSDVLERAPEQFKSPTNQWVGISGRARVLVYNPQVVESLGLTLPASITDLVDAQYQGQVGWAPSNASFQSNVTALRLLLGEDAAADWLAGMVANGTVSFGSSNTNLNQAVADGEIAMGITNHYYMFRILAQNPDAPIAQHFFPAGDPGTLINIAGAGVLSTSDQPGLAQRFILYLLGGSAQQYFADRTFEYPLIDGIAVNERLTPLTAIEPPMIDLSDLDDLQATLAVIEDSGALD
jgi:iron(III) transport system substrate-binding protein